MSRKFATNDDAHADKLVMKTAVGMAEAVFEEAMSKDNELYRGMRASHPGKPLSFLRKVFVRNLAPKLLVEARATLGAMLVTSTDEGLKAEIYEALLRDKSLRLGRPDNAPPTHH